MTKYQMIFVKIEIYLTNFSAIIQRWNDKLARIAFNNIKNIYIQKKRNILVKSTIMVLKIRRPLMVLKKVMDSKAALNKFYVFEKLQNIKKNEEMKKELKDKFEKELNSLKSF